MLCVCARVRTCRDGDEWACGSVKINKAWRAWNLECSSADVLGGVYLVVVRTACLHLIST